SYAPRMSSSTLHSNVSPTGKSRSSPIPRTSQTTNRRTNERCSPDLAPPGAQRFLDLSCREDPLGDRLHAGQRLARRDLAPDGPTKRGPARTLEFGKSGVGWVGDHRVRDRRLGDLEASSVDRVGSAD